MTKVLSVRSKAEGLLKYKHLFTGDQLNQLNTIYDRMSRLIHGSANETPISEADLEQLRESLEKLRPVLGDEDDDDDYEPPTSSSLQGSEVMPIKPDVYYGGSPFFGKSNSLNILVDSDVDQELLADFLAIYSELSDGDELIVREGKMPAGVEEFA